MCSAGSIRPPSTKITKTIASTGRWQSNPMSSSREKKKGKKYWTEEASHGADILPAVLNVADLAFRRLWKFDSHHRSSQLYVRLFLFSPYNLCPSLSLAKIKKKKKKKITSGQLASCPSTLAFFLFGPFRVTSHCRWREREHGCWSAESPCVAIRHQTRRQRSRGGEEEKWRRWINKVHSAQQRGGKDGRLVLLLCLGWFPDVRLFISHAHRQTHEV